MPCRSTGDPFRQSSVRCVLEPAGGLVHPVPTIPASFSRALVRRHRWCPPSTVPRASRFRATVARDHHGGRGRCTVPGIIRASTRREPSPYQCRRLPEAGERGTTPRSDRPASSRQGDSPITPRRTLVRRPRSDIIGRRNQDRHHLLLRGPVPKLVSDEVRANARGREGRRHAAPSLPFESSKRSPARCSIDHPEAKPISTRDHAGPARVASAAGRHRR